MASQLFARASDELRRTNDRLRRLRDERKTEGRIAAAGASSLAGAAIAGLVDAKWGEGGEPANLWGVPINGALGGAAAISAAAFDIPYRAEIGAAGIGAAGAALYRYITDNVSFEEEE